MAKTLVEKQVMFSGIWRPRHFMDDAFLKIVSRQFQEKPGAKATWRLTTEGLTIVVQQTESGRQGQTDQIPVQAVKEVTVNRYNSLCLMTAYVDSLRRFNVLVCCCATEHDAAHIVQVFGQLQTSLSGEGYRIDLKKPQGINWTLKTKENGEGEEEADSNGGALNGHGDDKNMDMDNLHHHHHHHHHHGNHDNYHQEDIVLEKEEETLEREPLELEGRACFNVGVQADLGPDDDTVSMASDMSYQSLKDELVSLSNEVRDIKILLEQTTGISAEEFFRRRRDPEAPALVPVKRLSSQESDGRVSGESGHGEKRVNFASLPAERDESEDMDFDIRSVGMQTADSGSKRRKYLKRVRNALTPTRYQQNSSSSLRSRSASSSSSLQASPGPMSPYSPASNADGSVFSYPSSSAHFQRPAGPSRDPRYSPGSTASLYTSGGTVARPIESVYHAHTSGFRQKRRQMIVLPPRSASMTRHVRRTPSDSSASGGGYVVQAPRSAAARAAQNGSS